MIKTANPDLPRTILSILFCLFLLADVASAEEGVWSKQSFAVPRQRAFKVPSPDRKKTVIIQEMMLAVTEAGMPVPGIEGYTVVIPAEIAWAPDSKAFALTANEGGQDGAWYVTVYLLEYDRVNYYDVTAEAISRFRERFPCMANDEPNAGAIKWTKESKNLLIAVEASARSSCKDKHDHWGYIVEVPSGKVLTELAPNKLREDWSEYLGPRINMHSLR